MSQSETFVHIGIGANSSVPMLTVIWPGGKVEEFNELPANERIRIVAGQQPVTLK